MNLMKNNRKEFLVAILIVGIIIGGVWILVNSRITQGKAIANPEESTQEQNTDFDKDGFVDPLYGEESCGTPSPTFLCPTRKATILTKNAETGVDEYVEVSRSPQIACNPEVLREYQQKKQEKFKQTELIGGNVQFDELPEELADQCCPLGEEGKPTVCEEAKAVPPSGPQCTPGFSAASGGIGCSAQKFEKAEEGSGGMGSCVCTEFSYICTRQPVAPQGGVYPFGENGNGASPNYDEEQEEGVKNCNKLREQLTNKVDATKCDMS